MSLDIESLLIFFGLLLAAYELHLNRKSQFIEIAYKNRERYARLLEDRQAIDRHYQDQNFNLEKLKTKSDYNQVIHHETKYFWFVFDSWVEGHVRKSIPKYLRRDWDYGVAAAMKNPVHRQAWENVIQHLDFLGYQEFRTFIAKHYAQGGSLSETL